LERSEVGSDNLPQGGDYIEIQGCGVWILAAFWGTLFQLAVSRFYWIDKVMEEMGEKVGRMLNKEASMQRTKCKGDQRGDHNQRPEEEVPLVDVIPSCSGAG
jgi:hypothetical protein